MSKHKKRKKAKELAEARGRVPAGSNQGEVTMTSDTPHGDENPDFQAGTAEIRPVTDAMMDHAAHEAAALADGVAHGASRAADAGAEVAQRSVEAGGEVAEAAGTAVTRITDASMDAAAGAADRAADAASRTADAARESASATASALAQYNAKVIEVMRANVDAATRHMAALIGAKSIPEAMSLNAEHIRQQIEVMTAQGRELTLLGQRAAFGAFEPFKRAAEP